MKVQDNTYYTGHLLDICQYLDLPRQNLIRAAVPIPACVSIYQTQQSHRPSLLSLHYRRQLPLSTRSHALSLHCHVGEDSAQAVGGSRHINAEVSAPADEAEVVCGWLLEDEGSPFLGGQSGQARHLRQLLLRGIALQRHQPRGHIPRIPAPLPHGISGVSAGVCSSRVQGLETPTTPQAPFKYFAQPGCSWFAQG